MKLPKNNKYEDDETVSKLKFRALLPTDKFEVQKEDEKDRGVDYQIEIKLKGEDGEIYHSNFRFNLQLKTSIVEKNRKGYYTLSIESSNINYLLNNGMPGYYVLYHVEEKKLFYSKLNELVRSLHSKGKEIDSQDTHTIHFKKELTEDVITEFYDETLERGHVMREISMVSLRNTQMSVNNNLILSDDYRVTSTTEIIEFIEKFGILLTNKGRWREVLVQHRKLSSEIDTNSIYDMAVGISMYYTGEIYTSVSFFKRAIKKGGLSGEELDYADYFLALAKFTLGAINQEEYDLALTKITTSEELMFFIKLKKKEENLFSSSNSSFRDSLVDILIYLDEFLENESTAIQVLDAAKCEKIHYFGLLINSDYLSGLKSLKNPLLFLDEEYRNKFFKSIQDIRQQWSDITEFYLNDLLDRKKHFNYCLGNLKAIKITYQFMVFSAQAKFMRTEKEEDLEDRDSQKTTLSLLDRLDVTYKYFKSVNHIENLCAVLAQKYEIFHFNSMVKECQGVTAEFNELFAVYDLDSQKKKFEFMINGGTSQEQSLNIIRSSIERKSEVLERIDQIQDEISKINNIDASKAEIVEDSFHIELFPIGYFKFPQEKSEIVMDFLGVPEDKCDSFQSKWELGVIPVANIYKSPVPHEGHFEGLMEDQGLSSWENILRIRKAFFEEEFRRVIINF